MSGCKRIQQFTKLRSTHIFSINFVFAFGIQQQSSDEQKAAKKGKIKEEKNFNKISYVHIALSIVLKIL